MKYRVALVGNPNVGKTTLYNRLTHSFEHVGNWQGVTVGAASKTFRAGDDEIEITDLPGLYSLTVFSPEEAATRDCLYEGKYDLFAVVCDAGNLSRGLCLTLQMLEEGAPVLLVANMMDEVKRRGISIDLGLLEKKLRVPVVGTAATRRKSADELRLAIMSALKNKRPRERNYDYLGGLDISAIASELGSRAANAGFSPEWAAIKLCEGDEYVTEKLALSPAEKKKFASLASRREEIARRRYAFIDGILGEAVGGGKRRRRFSLGEAVDRIVLGKWTALPVFFAVMGLIFYITFALVGNRLAAALDTVIRKCVFSPVTAALNAAGAPEWVVRLIGEGVILGAVGILKFLPQVVLLFFFLALLEDSGYISRVAFMTDGLFGKIGLSGRAAFTMLMGFGCSATAVLTVRGEADERTRKKTAILTPMLSCSARLPVFTAIAGAYFAGGSAAAVFGMYLLGAAAAILWAAALNKIKRMKSGERSFIMDVPPYRFPTFERMGQILIQNTLNFLARVGSIIFALNVIVWILANFSLTGGFTAGGEESLLATLGGLIAPIMRPLGFGNWRAVTALLGGVVAKEGVLAAIESMGGVGAIFTGEYASAAALSFMTFTLLYVPCIATLAAEIREAGAGWTALGAALQFASAYLVSLVVYGAGRLAIDYPAAGVTAAACGAVVLVAALSLLCGRTGCNGCKKCRKGRKKSQQKRIEASNF